MPQNIHEILLEIADDQGWNKDSQIILLCRFLQRIVDDPEWTANGELLLRHWHEYLQGCADEENEVDSTYCAECRIEHHDTCSMTDGCPCCDETKQNNQL